MRIFRPLLIWITNTKFYSWLLIHVIPYIRFSLYYTSLRGWKYNRGYKLLKPGHIILTRDDKKLTSLLIGGEFSHAALCVGLAENGDDYEVAEMTHNNYTKSDFFDICKESDRVIILECVDFDEEYVKKVVEKCKSFENAVYDIEFDFGVQALYCSELVYQADVEDRLKVDLQDIAGLGRQYISPTGLYESINVKVVWDSNTETREDY